MNKFTKELVDEFAECLIECARLNTKHDALKRACWKAQEKELNRNIKYHNSTDYSDADIDVSEILMILNGCDSPNINKILEQYKKGEIGYEDE